MKLTPFCKIRWSSIPFLLIFSAFSFFATGETKTNVYKRFTALQCDSLINSNINNPDFVVLDVRTPGEWNSYHIRGSVNKSTGLPDFTAQLNSLPKHKVFLIHCQSGGRSAGAFAKMKELGFAEVYELIGGINSWKNSGLPTTTLVEPRLMLVSHSDVIHGTNSDTIKITLTNRANGILAFNSVSVTDIHQVINNFDANVSLEGAQDYTFYVVHPPEVENNEETKINIESNGGNIGIDIAFKNGTVATEEIELPAEISLYPNPADQFLQINNPAGKPIEEFSLINLAGQKILQKTYFSDSNRIDLANLNNGIYIVHIKTNNRLFTRKIIIKH